MNSDRTRGSSSILRDENESCAQMVNTQSLAAASSLVPDEYKDFVLGIDVSQAAARDDTRFSQDTRCSGSLKVQLMASR